MQTAAAESWAVPPNAGAYDPLLASLVHVTGLLGRPSSAEALAAGLPVPETGLTPELFVRAAAPVDLVRDNPVLVQKEQALYESRRRDFAAGRAVLERQAEQRKQELAELQARDNQLQHSYELVQQELAMTRPAAEKGVISKVELVRLERQANDLLGELEVARLSVPRLEAAEREVRERTEQYTAEFRSAASRELSDVRGDQSMVSASNVALVDRLARTTVRAPVAGTIKQVKVWAASCNRAWT